MVRLAISMILLAANAVAAGAPQRMYSAVPEIRRGEHILWTDPGAVENLDIVNGIGGAANAPRPPFTFLKADSTGSTPKILVRDANDRRWSVKFGPETGPDVFASRLAWAVGYYVEPNYFVAEGVIDGVSDAGRAASWIDGKGRFRNARFQLRASDPEYLDGVGWSWEENPFNGTPQLNGLKIMMMLTSNWDDKDIRDAASRGSNAAVFRRANRYFFLIDDWGGSMGGWGHYLTRTKGNALEFDNQTKKFVRGVQNGEVRWGYSGQHTSAMTAGIRVDDVRWLLQYLCRVTDRQLDIALRTCGATPDEAIRYTNSIRDRIRQLQAIASNYSD